MIVVEVAAAPERFGVDRVVLVYPETWLERIGLWLRRVGEPHVDGLGRSCRLVRETVSTYARVAC